MIFNKNEVSKESGTFIFAALVILVFLLSLYVRLEYRSNLSIDNPVRGDAFYYLSYGYNLAKHSVLSREPTFNSNKIPVPDSFCPPGFPALVALAIKFGGLEDGGFYPLLLLINAFIGAIIAPMIFYIASRILPLGMAFFASLITAVSAHMLSIGGYILTENLFSFVHILSLFFLVIGVSKKSYIYCGLSGFFMGLAYLVNPIIFFLPFILSFVYYIHSRKNLDPIGPCIKRINIYLFFFFLVFSLWTIRNLISVPDVSLRSSNRAAINLLNGLYPDYYESYKNGEAFKPDYPMNVDIRESGGSINNALSIIYDKLKKEPGKYVKWYIGYKPFLFWSWDIGIGEGDVYVYKVKDSLFTKSPLWNSIKSLFKHINNLFVILTVCGAVILYLFPRHNEQKICIFFVYAIVVYVTLIYTVFQTDPRYSIPFRPELYMLAIFACNEIVTLIREWSNRFVR